MRMVWNASGNLPCQALLTIFLYLAVRAVTYNTVFQAGVGKLALQNKALRLIVFDTEREKITQWIK